MASPLGRQQRDLLLSKASSYCPTYVVVTDYVAVAIRRVLVAGVHAHHAGGVVRGVVSNRDITTVGALLSQFIPAMESIGYSVDDLPAMFSRSNIRWWRTHACDRSDTPLRRDATTLKWVRSWLADDPAEVWLADLMDPDPPSPTVGAPAQGGYTAGEMAQIFTWARSHSTQLRCDKATAMVALAFGAGLSAREMLGVNGDDVAGDGSAVIVGASELSVRPEAAAALAELKARSVFPLGQTQPLNGIPDPSGLHVTTTRLRLTWGIAQLADGLDFATVASRIPQQTALRAAAAATTFGNWPGGVVLSADGKGLGDVAELENHHLGTELPCEGAARRSQTYPRLRLVGGR